MSRKHGVSSARVGDQVLVEPTLRCGACFYCRRAEYNRFVDFVKAFDRVKIGGGDYCGPLGKS